MTPAGHFVDGVLHKLAQESQSLCCQFANEKVDACQVAAGPGEAGNKTEPDRITALRDFAPLYVAEGSHPEELS